MKTVVYLAMIVFSTHCSNVRTKRGTTKYLPDGSGRRVAVSGGHPATIGQYPWIVHLKLFNNETLVSCGGSLISDRYVLTAGHCCTAHPHTVKVYLGDYDQATFPTDCFGGKCTHNEVIDVDKYLGHENYDPDNGANDIALLRLKTSPPLSALIQPISLPPFDVDNNKYAFTSLTIVGWGATENTNRSRILQTAVVYLLPSSQCANMLNPLPPKHLCAGDYTGQNACRGDSGGPLIMNYNDQNYVAGIVSYGPDVKCGTQLATAYTNVFKYKNWIENNMKTLS